MVDLQTKKLKYPIVQSPMAGCSDLAFRLSSRKRGMKYCFLEMVSANGLVQDSKKTERLLMTVPEDRPVGAQLVGCDPDIMAEAAARVEDMGFDHLDLNLGCPVPKITSNGAGAALLDTPKKAEMVFTRVVRAVRKIPVTVKIRKGFKDDSGRQAIEIAKIAEGAGIGAVTVHGRTQAQGYTGKADWAAIGRVKRAVSIPVLGNGDVLSVLDARALYAESGCDGIMIGRGGLGNPWLFDEILGALYENRLVRPPTLEEKKEAVLEHADLEEKFLGPERAPFPMRRVGGWYIAGLPNAAHYRSEINRAATIPQIKEILTRCFDAAIAADKEADHGGRPDADPSRSL